MRRQLTSSSSLETLKKEAKRWLQAVRSNDSAALHRLQVAHPNRPNTAVCLRDIQHALALEHGAESWQSLSEKLHQATVASVQISAPAAHAPYSIDHREKTIAPKGLLDANDWDRILSAIEEQRISTVDARGQMTDAALKQLARLDHVTTLRLESSKQLTEEGLKHLANMPKLLALELGGSVTDATLKTLTQLPELRSFQMCWQTGVSDNGIANLAFCDHLESVNLMGSTVGDGAIAALAGKVRLHQLKTGRLVTDSGLQRLQDVPIFKTWEGGKPAYTLMSANAGPNHLLIDGPFTDEGVSALVGPDGLNGVFGLSFFWHCTAITPACLTNLSQVPNLGFLGVEGKLCNDEAMKYIAELPQLKMLMAQGAVASDDGFEALSRSQTLEYMWGRACPYLSGRGFASLSNLRTLRGIAVSCKNVDEKALSTLPEFPALREFMPMDIPDEHFRHIGACKKLEKLWCMYCRETGDAATEHLANLQKLKSYYAGATRITDRSLEILGQLNSLQSIDLWKCAGITDDGIRSIAKLPRLRKVTLDGMAQITDEALVVFPSKVHVKHTV